MMKKLKKVLVLLLTAAFLLSALAGCGKKENDEPKTDDKGSSQTQGEGKEDTKDDQNTPDDSQGDTQTAGADWSWPLPEQKELSIWLAWSCDYADDPNELRAIQQIEENTNVHINWVTVLGAEAAWYRPATMV